MAHREPRDTPQRPDELDEQDQAFRCPVDRGPPDRGGERVGVVDLGEVLARYVPHKIKTSLRLTDLGEIPGAAGMLVPAAPPEPLTRTRIPLCPPPRSLRAVYISACSRRVLPALGTGTPRTAGCADPGRFERVGQPSGLVHVRRHRQPGELHRNERHPRASR